MIKPLWLGSGCQEPYGPIYSLGLVELVLENSHSCRDSILLVAVSIPTGRCSHPRVQQDPLATHLDARDELINGHIN